MKTLALLFFCLSPLAFAKTHAPLPDALLNAKTVYIVNETGYQGVADFAYDSFTKWNHFTVVQTKQTADLVIIFGITIHMNDGDSMRSTVMSVYSPNSTDPLYQTTEHRDSFKDYGSSAKNCINDFRKRLETK